MEEAAAVGCLMVFDRMETALHDSRMTEEETHEAIARELEASLGDDRRPNSPHQTYTRILCNLVEQQSNGFQQPFKPTILQRYEAFLRFKGKWRTD